MRPFRFRAAAALDLRRKEEESARLRLAQAQKAFEQTQLRLNHAMAAANAASDQFMSDQHAGIEAWRLSWHQSWIRKQRQDADTSRKTAAVSASVVERAAASVTAAHQQRRALERLRERALKRHQLEASRQEGRDMNLLANLRYLAKPAGSGGSESDDRSDHEHGGGTAGRDQDR